MRQSAPVILLALSSHFSHQRLPVSIRYALRHDWVKFLVTTLALVFDCTARHARDCTAARGVMWQCLIWRCLVYVVSQQAAVVGCNWNKPIRVECHEICPLIPSLFVVRKMHFCSACVSCRVGCKSASVHIQGTGVYSIMHSFIVKYTVWSFFWVYYIIVTTYFEDAIE
jgi:hypothetical protein